MKYRTAAAFRAALEARLKAEQRDGVGISRLRKRVVFERLLARLQAVAPAAWVLKGGFALELRLEGSARTTKDIDIDWNADEQEAVELLLDAAALRLDDLFEFSVERSRMDDDLLGGGQRWSVTTTLAGRVFERLAIDIGFATAPVLEPETVGASHLLDFADIEPIRVPALAIEQHVAEKLHAYTRTYAGEKPSSRVKDLVDLLVIAHTTASDAERLERATGAIFERRATHPLPAAVPAPPVDWAPAWRKLVADIPVEEDVRAGHLAAAAFLDPVLARDVTSGRWDPVAREWTGQ